MSYLALWLTFTARCGNILFTEKTKALSLALPPCTYSGKTWVKFALWRSYRIFKERGSAPDLVKKCIEEADSMGLKKVFALTTRPDFFKRLGFRQVPNDDLPKHYLERV